MSSGSRFVAIKCTCNRRGRLSHTRPLQKNKVPGGMATARESCSLHFQSDLFLRAALSTGDAGQYVVGGGQRLTVAIAAEIVVVIILRARLILVPGDLETSINPSASVGVTLLFSTLNETTFPLSFPSACTA